MKKKYTRKSNPVNTTGYTPGYSTERNPYNIIPSEDITMRNTPYPIQGTPLDQNGQPMGNSIIMQPGQEYKFGGASYVFETPHFASGGTKQSWISEKIGKLMHEGHPQKQAIAIAYSMYNQHHSNGGYQMPEYQIGGNKQVGFAQGFGNPDYDPNANTAPSAMGTPQVSATTALPVDPNAPTPESNKLYNDQQALGSTGQNTIKISDNELANPTQETNIPGKKLQSRMDFNKSVNEAADNYDSNGNVIDKSLAEDASKKARTDFETAGASGNYQFYNPYGGYGMQESLFKAGQAVEKGDTFGAVANGANVLLKGSKDFLSGMGSANREQQQKATYYQKQREGMTGQNRAQSLKRGGRFSMPKYQDAGTYDENNPYGYEGEVGDNEAMDKYINSARQKNDILLRGQENGYIPTQSIESQPEEAKKEEEEVSSFDSKSARDTWVHKTGMPWSKAKELGYTTGSAKDNTKLLSELNDDRFKKENLRTEAPKRKTANRKAIELAQPAKTVKRLPPNVNAYGIDTNSPEVIAYREAIDKKSAEEDAKAKKTWGYGKPAYVDPHHATLSGPTPTGYVAPNATQSRSIMFPNYVAPRVLTPLEQSIQDSTGHPYISGNAFEYGGQYQKGGKHKVEANPNMTQQELIDISKKYNVSPKEFTAIVTEGNVFPGAGSYRYEGGNTNIPVDYLKQYRENDKSLKDTVLDYFGFRTGGYYQEGGQQGQVVQQVAQALQQGAQPEQVTRMLIQSGMTQDEAIQTVQAVIQQIQSQGHNASEETAEGGQQNPQEEQMEQATPQLKFGGRMYQAGGVQSPQEEQQEGAASNPQEEQGEIPQQGGGQEAQVQQIMQQITQALQQGAQPEQIMQQLVQMGIPQEQAQQMIQMAMQQTQGGQQQAPQGTPQLRKGGYYQAGGVQSPGEEQQEGAMSNPQEEQGEVPQQGGQGQMQQVAQQVAQALQQGADPQQILQQLVKMGIPQQQAQQLIQQVIQQIQQQGHNPQEEAVEGGMENPKEEQMEQGNPQMRAGGKYLEILKGKTIKNYSLNKKTGNYEVQYS